MLLSPKAKKVWFTRSVYFMLFLVGIFILFPVAWMASTALKTEQEALAIPPTLLPKVATVFGFEYMWQMKPFLKYFMNSLLTAGPTALISTLFGGLAAYSVSRFRFAYRKPFMTIVLCTQMIPGVLLVGPYFKVLNQFGLFDTHFGLTLGYTAVALPFCTWMLKGYFDSVPRELDEAALVDGCTKIGALFVVILPLSVPGMVATGIFAFLLAWGDLLWALCLTSSETVTTVTLGIANSVGEYRVVWPALMAAALIACVPSVVFYSFLQKYIVGGMTKGGVKG
ncbi:multiple sugar transport system permease protein [Hydrogenispora ethanolica]|jgi:ABC-type glycerol-3-phosphate transport system permease component|uniref:Multiple sugar transport system permease protein n=1 Tax=Hydrogenispora ethanolica TaxID=1082276 RepID=A0A4R1QY65_HYDET|nr:carbohydrate ABC transporter permease [Hydrogenispora ethanolica]TCL57714.1 multiple sugar transport system permease protein [Hydrogenispora ethanolica]